MTSTALLLVDVQHDFIDGSLAISGSKDIIPTVLMLLELEWQWTAVICSQDFHPPGHISFASSHPGHAQFEELLVVGKDGIPFTQCLWPDHCIQGTKGSELIEQIGDAIEMWNAQNKLLIARKGTDPLVEAYSAFEGSIDGRPVQEVLRRLGISRIVAGGVATDYCVKSSVLSACRHGFEVIVIPEAIRGVNEAACDAAMQEMANAGAKVIPLKQLTTAIAR